MSSDRQCIHNHLADLQPRLEPGWDILQAGKYLLMNGFAPAPVLVLWRALSMTWRSQSRRYVKRVFYPAGIGPCWRVSRSSRTAWVVLSSDSENRSIEQWRGITSTCLISILSPPAINLPSRGFDHSLSLLSCS